MHLFRNSDSARLPSLILTFDSVKVRKSTFGVEIFIKKLVWVEANIVSKLRPIFF